jgi:hypothetical protein
MFDYLKNVCLKRKNGKKESTGKAEVRREKHQKETE